MSLTHHATLFYAPSLDAIRAQVTIDRQSPDQLVFEAETLSISDVRAVQAHAIQRPVSEPERLIVLLAKSIALEAQHALLKLLEEPAATTRFVIVLSGNSPLLPTVLSRVAVGTTVHASKSDDTTLFTEWSRLSYSERIAEVGEHTKKKDTTWMRMVLMGAAEQSPVVQPHFKRYLSENLTWSQLRGASLKMLLEELALTVPVVKR